MASKNVDNDRKDAPIADENNTETQGAPIGLLLGIGALLLAVIAFGILGK